MFLSHPIESFVCIRHIKSWFYELAVIILCLFFQIKPDVQPIINPYSDIIFSELEVTGTITCDESEWGAAASDVILSDTDPIHIYGDKVFKSDVNVENNLEINGLVGGVNVSELLTKDTVQMFTGNLF